MAEWKKADVLELSVQEDHVHLVASITPKVSVSELLGILEGKTAIKLLKSYPGMRKKPYRGNHFWSTGYCVSILGEIPGTEGKTSRKGAEGIWPLLEAELEKPPAEPVVVLCCPSG